MQIADKISSSRMDALGMIEDQKQLDDNVKFIVILQTVPRKNVGQEITIGQSHNHCRHREVGDCAVLSSNVGIQRKNFRRP